METEAVEITELLPVYFGRHEPSPAGMVSFFFYISVGVASKRQKHFVFVLTVVSYLGLGRARMARYSRLKGSERMRPTDRMMGCSAART